MNAVEKVNDYLSRAQIFYVTTVDSDRPKCRPFGFKTVYDGKIYFGVGSHKDCYRQMLKNANVEICASDGNGFLRYYGRAVFVEDEALLKQAFS